MRQTLALLGYAITAGTLGAAALRSARWTERAPRMGVAAWQILSGSVLTSLLLVGISLNLPRGIVSGGLAELLHACATALRAQYATAGGVMVHAPAAIATLALITRTGFLLTRELLHARRTRERHLAALIPLAHHDSHLGALIVDHPACAAYCLPGRARTIVLTTSAIAALQPDELAAVLAHERAHLRGRHHLVVASADALERTLPILPVFRWANAEIGRLLEMVADDGAVRHADPLTVARALVRLAEGPVPNLALGAADLDALTRVQRLVSPSIGLGLLRRGMIAGGLVLTAAVPLAIVAPPAWNASHADYCPIPAATRSA